MEINRYTVPGIPESTGRLNTGRVGRNRVDFGCSEPGSASRISFFSWRNKESKVLILPILDQTNAQGGNSQRATIGQSEQRSGVK